MKQALFTFLFSLGLMACGGDFSPTLGDSDGSSSIGMTDGMDTEGETEGDTDAETGTDEGDTDDETGTGGLDMGTEDPPESPGPGEPCDPFLAVEGIAPCINPEFPLQTWSCVPVEYEEGLNNPVENFHCVKASDPQGDGFDLLDPCSDGAGGPTYNGDDTLTGCVNAWCLWNGFSQEPNPEFQNFPEGACPWYPNGPEEGAEPACCSPFCDDQNPCDQGYECKPLADFGMTNIQDLPDVGTCVWNG